MSENLAQKVDRVSGDIEAALTSIVGRIATWVSPIPIATLTARSISKVYGLPLWVAAMSAIALELIGVATSQHWIRAREWNATKNKSDPPENEFWPLAMLVVYFVADCAIISAIELPVIAAGELDHLISILFPLMGIIGVVVMSMRVSHRHKMAEIEQRKEEARHKRASARQEREAERRREAEQRKRREEARLKLAGLGPAAETVRWFAVNPMATHAEAAAELGIARRTVGLHLSQAATEGVITRNGKGVEVLL